MSPAAAGLFVGPFDRGPGGPGTGQRRRNRIIVPDRRFPCRRHQLMSANPLSPVVRPEEYPPTGGDHHWSKASRPLRARLVQEIPHEVLKELHRKSPARHLLIAARQFAILAAASAVSWLYSQPWIWIPSALVAGWTIF